MPYKNPEKRRDAARISMRKKRSLTPRVEKAVSVETPLSRLEKQRGYNRAYRKKIHADPETLSAHLEQRHEGRAKQRHAKQFIAIDGEGVTRSDGQHDYIMMCASTGESIVNVDGLSTSECFDFLLNLAIKHTSAIFVMFGSTYDITKILKDVSTSKLRAIWESKNKPTNSVQWSTEDNTFSMSYVPRRKFCLRRFSNEQKWQTVEVRHRDGRVTKEHNPNYEASITIYDSIDFFQGKFVKTLKEWFQSEMDATDVITFEDGYKVDTVAMQAMKRSRDTFSVNQLLEIEAYCRDECIALARLMERLREKLLSVGIDISRWNGSGACANFLLKQHKTSEAIRETSDERLRDVQRRAYAGGRFEVGQVGTYVGTVYNYDINSAFPYAMTKLPRLTDGRWRHVEGESRREYSLMRVVWNFDSQLPYYPFPYRDDTGIIFFPPAGESWVWRPELDAAKRALCEGKLSGSIEIIESWEFQPYGDEKPFAFISDLYDQRSDLKKQGDAAEKAIKLTVNSFYGKLLQAVGTSEEAPSRFFNIGLAGYTLSLNRAMILDAIMQQPGAVIQITADGLYSTAPLVLDIGKELGQWKESRLDGIVTVRSGVYWSLFTREAEPSQEDQQEHDFTRIKGKWYEVSPHYQGFNEGSLKLTMILEEWKRFSRVSRQEAYSIIAKGINIETMRFITFGTAMASDEHLEKLGTWQTDDRTLKIFPSNKRRLDTENNKAIKLHERMYLTIADTPQCYSQSYGTSELSYPYTPRSWREEPLTVENGIDTTIIEQEIADSWF